MDWKKSISAVCEKIIDHIHETEYAIKDSGYERPVFGLKVYSDGTCSIYVESEDDIK